MTRLTIWKRKHYLIRLNMISNDYNFESSWSSFKNLWHLKIDCRKNENFLKERFLEMREFFLRMRDFLKKGDFEKLWKEKKNSVTRSARLSLRLKNQGWPNLKSILSSLLTFIGLWLLWKKTMGINSYDLDTIRATKAQLGWVVTMLTTKVEENSP